MRNILIGLIIGISLCLFYYWRDKPYNIVENEINLKSIDVKYLDGNPADLLEFKNEKTYFYFWGTYCAPCIEKLPKLNALACNETISIVCISAEDTNTIKNYIDHFSYDCIDFIKVEQKFSEFGIRLIPKLIEVTSSEPKLLSRNDIDELIKESL